MRVQTADARGGEQLRLRGEKGQPIGTVTRAHTAKRAKDISVLNRMSC